MKKIVRGVAVISSLLCLINFAPSQIAFADENSDQQIEKKEVTTQTLYWECINQDTGELLKTIKVDTVKVVNGVPERQFFHMGRLPEKIGNLEIAGNPWGGRDLEVDHNNKSGAVYLKAGYYDAEAYEERSKNNFGWGDPKQQGIINTTLMEYKAYHGTSDGYIAPGYYDDNNEFHGMMTVDEWCKKNHMPRERKINPKNQSSEDKEDTEDQSIDNVSDPEDQEQAVSTNRSKKSKDSNKKNTNERKRSSSQNKVENTHSSVFHSSLFYLGIVVIGIVVGIFFIPKKFWRKIFGGKGRHSK